MIFRFKSNFLVSAKISSFYRYIRQLRQIRWLVLISILLLSLPMLLFHLNSTTAIFCNSLHYNLSAHTLNHHHHRHLSGGRRCASNPWPRLIALSHCSRRGISDCIRGFIHVSRGLPRGCLEGPGRGNEGEGQRPQRSWTAVHRALFAGTSSVSLATCPKRARRRLLIGAEIGGRPVFPEMITFLIMSCHLIPSIRLWARMWKACRRSKSAFKMVHVSEP